VGPGRRVVAAETPRADGWPDMGYPVCMVQPLRGEEEARAPVVLLAWVPGELPEGRGSGYARGRLGFRGRLAAELSGEETALKGRSLPETPRLRTPSLPGTRRPERRRGAGAADASSEAGLVSGSKTGSRARLERASHGRRRGGDRQTWPEGLGSEREAVEWHDDGVSPRSHTGRARSCSVRILGFRQEEGGSLRSTAGEEGFEAAMSPLPGGGLL